MPLGRTEQASFTEIILLRRISSTKPVLQEAKKVQSMIRLKIVQSHKNETSTSHERLLCLFIRQFYPARYLQETFSLLTLSRCWFWFLKAFLAIFLLGREIFYCLPSLKRISLTNLITSYQMRLRACTLIIPIKYSIFINW